MFTTRLHTRDPWRRFDDMDRIFRQLVHVSEPRAAWPPVTLEENGVLTLRALVPGHSRDDLEITATPDSLTIAGKRTLPEGYEAVRTERPSGAFERTFTFRTPIDPDQVTATVKDGVLTLTVARAKADLPRRITIEG